VITIMSIHGIIRDIHPGKPRTDVKARLSNLVSQSQNVVVTWEWYDKSQGIIKWTFTNTGKTQESVILLRNGYYFGGAFWPVYVANPEFGVTWMTEVKPLVDNGAENNAPPIAPVTFSNGYTQVLFIFTLSGGQTWSMLEGGFNNIMPQFQGVYTVDNPVLQTWCIGYDPQRVKDWDNQTGTTLQGYQPDPETITAVIWQASPGAPYDALPFNDMYCDTPCPCTLQPSPQPTCLEILENIAIAVEAGNFSSISVQDIIDAVECLFTGHVSLKHRLKIAVKVLFMRGDKR
jgi:hypothetical protein